MTSNACRKPSRRRGWNKGACGTSPQAQRCAHTPPLHPTSVDAQTPASPAAPREPPAPHNMTRLTPRPAAPPSNPEGGYSLGRAEAARRRRSLPAQRPAHPPQASRRQQTCPPAEPPRGRPSPTTRQMWTPAVAHCYPLPSQPLPLNVRPNTAQKKPSKPKADGHRRERQRAPLCRAAPNSSPQPSKPPHLPQLPSPSRSLIRRRGTRAGPHYL